MTEVSAPGPLEIRSGGIVAVDPESLRETARRFDNAAGLLDQARENARRVQIDLVPVRDAVDAAHAVHAVVGGLRDVVEGAEGVAAKLRRAAALYEIVESEAQLQIARAAGDTVETARLAQRMAWLFGEYPGLDAELFGLRVSRAVMWPGEMVNQATELGFDLGGVFDRLPSGARGIPFAWPAQAVAGATFGLLAVGYATLAAVTGLGKWDNTRRFEGPLPAVTVTPLPRPAHSEPDRAPRGLAEAAERVPSEEGARVRVEKYTMPDGSEEFVVYVVGTQSMEVGGPEAWDSLSNAQLYTGDASASYAATLAALVAAGAPPGAIVHAVGFSQGGMVTASLAIESDYDVQTHVALGNPVAADVGPDTLQVGIVHTDDPFTALAGGGHDTRAGGPGSITVETVYDPTTDMSDFAAPAHRRAAYVETAQRVDESGDPRVQAVHDVFEHLGQATAVQATEYAARRAEVGNAGSGGGGV